MGWFRAEVLRTIFPYEETFMADFPREFCGRQLFLVKGCEEGVYCYNLSKGGRRRAWQSRGAAKGEEGGIGIKDRERTGGFVGVLTF